MIYAIAALDSKNGIADETGIPWDLPADKTYFREKTTGCPILLGYHMYQEMGQPLPNRRNIVIVHPGTKLREGFESVEDPNELLDTYQASQEILWIVGGARVYEKLLSRTQRLYLTRIQADFNCTKFFPRFEDQFILTEQSVAHEDNGLKFCYEIWDSQSVLK